MHLTDPFDVDIVGNELLPRMHGHRRTHFNHGKTFLCFLELALHWVCRGDGSVTRTHTPTRNTLSLTLYLLGGVHHGGRTADKLASRPRWLRGSGRFCSQHAPQRQCAPRLLRVILLNPCMATQVSQESAPWHGWCPQQRACGCWLWVLLFCTSIATGPASRPNKHMISPKLSSSSSRRSVLRQLARQQLLRVLLQQPWVAARELNRPLDPAARRAGSTQAAVTTPLWDVARAVRQARPRVAPAAGLKAPRPWQALKMPR